VASKVPCCQWLLSLLYTGILLLKGNFHMNIKFIAMSALSAVLVSSAVFADDMNTSTGTTMQNGTTANAQAGTNAAAGQMQANTNTNAGAAMNQPSTTTNTTTNTDTTGTTTNTQTQTGY
jgi:hypothetical protein